MPSLGTPRDSLFAYYLALALRSFRRNKVLTALMVLAIALGIGASMTTLTVFHILAGDPLPAISDTLFYPRMDPRSAADAVPDEEPAEQMTRFDAESLLRDKRGDRQAVMTAGGVAVQTDDSSLDPIAADARFTSGDFFPMFATPFLHGNGWDAGADETRARVAVISKALNDKIYGGGNSVGKTIRLDQTAFRIVGVLDHWRPAPRFYDLTNDRFGEDEQVFVPFSTARELDFGTSGS
ncbi:MAG: ABC transporter permease, partial [Pseudomonadota bacterium]|nr:ABC transporter permease [Pseudomonadota bacterium]